ncbi:MAG TPA: AAA family ATPase [Candidatus Binataceae bacterium]
MFEVTGFGPLRNRLQRAAGGGLTRFVGREREIEWLQHAAQQAPAGRGQIVAAVAEPGVSKSRLFYEFKARHQSGWMVLEAYPVSHGKPSAYLPLIDLLCGYFKIGEKTTNGLGARRSREDSRCCMYRWKTPGRTY